MKKKHKQLLNFMAQSCHHAQSHCGEPESWEQDAETREDLLQCTSFQMACFLAQNTVGDSAGVGWDIILEELIDTTLNKNREMVKSIKEWKHILLTIVDELGGFKDAEKN